MTKREKRRALFYCSFVEQLFNKSALPVSHCPQSGEDRDQPHTVIYPQASCTASVD